MKRPTDQAKLLFFYLLRSSAALATTPAAATTSEGHICLRLARRTDVSSIQRCNLATLPENYNSQFYQSHLKQWPDLALVAEHVVPTSTVEEPNIVAYVLGKVEIKPVKPQLLSVLPPHCSHLNPDDLYELQQALEPPPMMEPMGHVTSLAVLREYRRQGLAAALMEQLHFHLEECYRVKGVGLHVRKSNQAACQLYERDGYNIDHVMGGYYQDGEDAYFMRKDLKQRVLDRTKKWRFQKERPWERQDDAIRLPRIMVPQHDHKHEHERARDGQGQAQYEPPHDPVEMEVMTGAM